MELKFFDATSKADEEFTPNCTLVELKYDEITGLIIDAQEPPNCTLVELKFRKLRIHWRLNYLQIVP